jgi:hypothetical protein
MSSRRVIGAVSRRQRFAFAVSSRGNIRLTVIVRWETALQPLLCVQSPVSLPRKESHPDQGLLSRVSLSTMAEVWVEC